jgi:hypothetical protein
MMMLSTDRLKKLLETQGFSLCRADLVTKDIYFVRPSRIHRLYEHLHICGQGKKGDAVYATTAISGSSAYSYDSCITEIDRSLLFALEADVERHWTIVNNTKQAKEWETKLAKHADSYCRATAQAKGPALSERLQPSFAAVDRYIDKVGDVNNIFDSEHRFCFEAAEEVKKEAERLAFELHTLESTDDVQLACLILATFATDVENRLNPFLERKVREDSGLRVRLYLLVDYFRDRRREYWARLI